MEIITQNGNICNYGTGCRIAIDPDPRSPTCRIRLENGTARDVSHNIGTYGSKETADKVMELIATALEQGRAVFRMPGEGCGVCLDSAVTKTLSISTAHVRQYTCDTWMSEQRLLAVYAKAGPELKASWGWYIPVDHAWLATGDGQEAMDAMPEDLRTAIRFAMEKGCSMLELDPEAVQVPGLPVYEWDA